MLTTLFMAFICKLMTFIHLDVVKSKKDVLYFIFFSFIAISIMISIFRNLLVKENKKKRYEEIYDEPVMAFIQIIYIVVNVCLLLKMYGNLLNNSSMLTGSTIFFVGLVILDIVNIIVGFNVYSFDTKEAIVDSFLIQLKNALFTLVVLTAILSAYKLTIVGATLIAIILSKIIIRK